MNIGMKIGLSTTDLDVGEIQVLQPGGGQRLALALEETKYGIHGGLIICMRFNSFILQPEVLFNSNSVDYEIEDFTGTSVVGTVKNEKYQYVDIPLLAGFKFGPLRLLAGPAGHVFVNSASELFDFEGYDQTFDDISFSFLLGAGLDLWSLALDVRYESGFDRFGDHFVFDGTQYEFSDNPSRFLFSLGYFF